MIDIWKKQLLVPLEGNYPKAIYVPEYEGYCCAHDCEEVVQALVDLSNEELMAFLTGAACEVQENDFIPDMIKQLEAVEDDMGEEVNVAKIASYLRHNMTLEDREALKRLL
jgi:hypothetical protein